MLVVDSSVWIDYFNGQDNSSTQFLDRILGVQEIAVGDLILTEVLQGFKSDKDFSQAKQVLNNFQLVEMLGVDRAIRAAEKYRDLRKAGTTVRKTNDVIIASYCIDEKIPLLFSDKDFNPFVTKLSLVPVLTE